METQTTITTNTSPARSAAIHSLAIVGFVALVVLGMTLAVYAARYVPKAISGIGSAAVYLSGIFVHGEPSSLTVVPTATTTSQTTITTIVIATSTPATTTMAVPPKTTTPKPATTYPVTTTYPTPGSTPVVAPVTLYGLANLTVTIKDKGYLTSNDTSTFISSTTVANGERPAIRFTITNTGTNMTGVWNFSADIPTTRSYTFTSDRLESMRPGDHVDFTLGFDRAKVGTDQTIVLRIDPDNQVTESNERDNSAETTLTVK